MNTVTQTHLGSDHQSCCHQAWCTLLKRTTRESWAHWPWAVTLGLGTVWYMSSVSEEMGPAPLHYSCSSSLMTRNSQYPGATVKVKSHPLWLDSSFLKICLFWVLQLYEKSNIKIENMTLLKAVYWMYLCENVYVFTSSQRITKFIDVTTARLAAASFHHWITIITKCTSG